jgi:predicted ATPase/DNA-binding SARP family transcriptional activator
MPHLSLSFLGGFEVTFDAEPVTAFGADKVRALLAYLAIESSRPHRRAELSAMFWPDLSEKKAAHNLSQSLLRLRQALREKKDSTSPSFLVVSPPDVQFNACSDCQLDVARFRELLNRCNQHNHADAASCGVCIQWLLQAAELYRGDLLTGLFVPDSVAFEEWRLIQQEELHRQALETLRRLAAFYEQRSEFERVQDYARRQIVLEPWSEEAHLQLMRALAQCGQVSAALKQYEVYQRTLVEELDIKPSAGVTLFYEQIRSGETVQKPAVQPGGEEAAWLSSQGERRQVTTLVCSRSVPGDSEEIQEQMGSCERCCESIFNRFGGRRSLRQGSTCLVYFGYPQAYEDAARRAVHSGLAVAATSEGSAQVRIGIHTGMMTIGERRGLRWQDRDLVGKALEIARDCQRLAGSGEVIITENTRRLLHESFDLQALMPQKVGDVEQPVQIYQVCRESSVQSRLDWLAQTQRLTQLTGREEELLQLKACREKLIQGKGQVVLLRGESGIGKSRLILELKNSTSILGVSTADSVHPHAPVLWLSSRCLPHYQDTSLYPMIGLLEQLLQFQSGDSLDVRREKLMGMLAWYHLNSPSAAWLLSLLLGLPTGTPAPETITKAQREQMREIFIALLQKRAAEHLLVVVIEDLHWSDPSSIDWLSQSIDFLADISCLTLLTARPGFNPTWLSHKDLRPNLLLLAPRPLRPEQVEQMVIDLAGDSLLEEEIRRHIVTQTDGIPLFVEELTKTLIERLVFIGAAKTMPEIPATLLDSLVARLDHLGSAKETAQWAAVLGREFSYPILQACVPFEELRLQGELARLIEAELISPVEATPQDVAAYTLEVPNGTAPLRYTFKHALVQEAAYASMLKRTRQVYHRRIAEILEIQFPQVAEKRPEILAQHYAHAGMQTQAVDYWLLAGEHATVQGATLEARIFFDRAIDLIGTGKDERLWKALWGRETALYFRGERTAQKEDIGALLALAETFGDDTRRAQAQIRRARYASSQADYRSQLEAAEAAITAAGRAGELTVEVEALVYKVIALMRMGERTALQQTVEKTLVQTQKVGDDPVRAYAMAAVALYHVEGGNLAQAIQFLTQSLEAARLARVRHLDLESQYQGHLGFTYAHLGLYTQAREALEVGLELANLMGIGRYQAYHKVNLGFVCWRMGDLNTAIQMEEQALKEYSATGETFGRTVCQTYLGYIYEGAGKLALAEKYLAEARAGYVEVEVDADKFETQAVEARVAFAQGRWEEARRLTVEVWNYLCEHGIEGLASPSFVYACIADVLDGVEIPGISPYEVIETAYRELMQSAEKISDLEWRRSFLEQVSENRAIVERWKQMGQVSISV